jgi:SAM-dependent methyltransferase
VVRDARADRRFRELACALGWAPDDPFVGGYVEREWRRARHLFETAGAPAPGARALELGCHFGGTAVVLAALGARVSAVDVDRRYVALTRLNAARHGLAARVRARRVADTERLPFEDGTFDLVSCNSVLEYVPPGALAGVLRELDRVLAPGGLVFVVGTSNRLWPYETHTRRWFTNYVPRAFEHLLFERPPRRGVAPWHVSRGFGALYADLTRRDRGRLLLEAKRRMGAGRGRLALLAACNRLLAGLGAHAGALTPSLTMVLQKSA